MVVFCFYGPSRVESHLDRAAKFRCSHILIKVIGSNRDRKPGRIRWASLLLITNYSDAQKRLSPEMNTSSGVSAYSTCQLADNIAQRQNAL